MRAAQTVAILPPTGPLGRSSSAAAVSWLDCSSWPRSAGRGTVMRGRLLRARKRIVEHVHLPWLSGSVCVCGAGLCDAVHSGGCFFDGRPRAYPWAAIGPSPLR